MANKIVVTAFLVLALGQAHAGIPVVADGLLKDAALLNQKLSPEKRAQLEKTGMELQMLSGQIDAGAMYYCYARIGLSYPEAKGRTSRLPSHFASSFYRKPKGSPLPACLQEAASSAMEELNNTAWNVLVKNPDQLLAKGGVRSQQPAKPGYFHVYSRGIGDAAYAVVNKVVEQSPVPKLFDYRQVATSVDLSVGEFDDVLVCVARAGLTARAPEGRGPHRPTTYGIGTAVIPVKQGEDQCEINAVIDALGKIFSDSWDQKGVLDNFAFTREDGLALPDARIVAAKYASLYQPKLAAAKATADNLSPACRDFFKHYPNGAVPASSGDDSGYYNTEANDAAMFNLAIKCNAERNRSR